MRIKVGMSICVGLLTGAILGAMAVPPALVERDEIPERQAIAKPLASPPTALGRDEASDTPPTAEAHPPVSAEFLAIESTPVLRIGDPVSVTPLAALKESAEPAKTLGSPLPRIEQDASPLLDAATSIEPFQMAQAIPKLLEAIPSPITAGVLTIGAGQTMSLRDSDAPIVGREWRLIPDDVDFVCDAADTPPGWDWLDFPGSACDPAINTAPEIDTVRLVIYEEGLYTLELSYLTPDGMLVLNETIAIFVTAAPEDPPSASLGFSQAMINDGSLLPLHDWMPLFQFTMSADEDQDTGAFAERVLGQVRYSINPGCFEGQPPFDALVAPAVGDILEYSLVKDNGADGPDGVLNLDPTAANFDVVVLTWANDGFPYQEPTDDLTYDLDFYNLGYRLADEETQAIWPRTASADDGGNGYFVAFRTSPLWSNTTSLSYSVQLTDRTMVDPNLFDPFTGDTPVPRDNDGELLDGDPPDPYPQAGDCIRMYSSFSVYDGTGTLFSTAPNGPGDTNKWTWPNKLYTPAAEHIRPRFDGVSQAFEMVTGEWMDLRQLFALETWSSVIGINLHAARPNGLTAGIREVNVIFTDIGADPDNPVAGNGGFDPRDGFDPFTTTDQHPGNVPAQSTLGREYPFNGAWLYHDTNDNSFFDVPEATESNGVNFTGDFPMDPELRLVGNGQVDPYKPGWEYIPNPPWGGDPAFKVRLRLSGGRRRNPNEMPSGHLDPTPDSRDLGASSWAVDYFLTIRPDSGFQDATLVPGDGTGLAPGANFRAFIEPRRFNPFLNDGEWDGGIWTDAQIGIADSFVVDPLTVEFPPQGSVLNNWPPPEGVHYHSFMDMPPPLGQNAPSVDPQGPFEKWWPQRTLNQNNAKAQRTTVEVHDLILTYSTSNQDAKELGIGYYGAVSIEDTLGLPLWLGVFDSWIDPFGQWWSDTAEGSFDNSTVFFGLHSVGTNTSSQIIVIPIEGQITIISDDLFAYDQQSYETVPFFLDIFDSPPFGPRSAFFPNPPPQRSLPGYSNWPRGFGVEDAGVEDALAPGQYPRKSDWDQVDRASRLLYQRANNNDPPTAMLGINLVGTDDPVVNRIAQSFLEEITVAVWGPNFTPSDLRPLDPNGLNAQSGVLLYEDTASGVPGSGNNLTGGIFNGTDSDFDLIIPTDTPVFLNNLAWESAAEPIDLDGDGDADDMDGDGDADEDDYAWVLRLRPQNAWPVPNSDLRYGGPLGTLKGGAGTDSALKEVVASVSMTDIPEGAVLEEELLAALEDAKEEAATKVLVTKALPPGGNEGDDLFVVIRPSDTVQAFENIRMVIPATLPSRSDIEKDAGIALSPNIHMPPDMLIRRSPEENPVQDWYGHDTLLFNVPTALVSLLEPVTLLEEGAEIGAGIPVPVIGVDASTNRPSAEATPYSSKLLGEGTRGTGTLSVSGSNWEPGELIGDFVIDSEFEPYEIIANTANTATMRSGTPREGAWLIARSPTFLEQMIVEFYDVGFDADDDDPPDTPDGEFNFAEDIASLDFEDPANGVSSGVSIYRDNIFHPNNTFGVFDPPRIVNGVVEYIDLPVRLDDRPVRLGIPGEPTNQIRFVFSSPGTDNVPAPLADQPRLRQWIPDSFGGLQAGDRPDFFVVLRSTLDMVIGDDFRVGIVSWGPNTPTEPDPDTFSNPPPPLQPADEFDIFSEFAWGTRAIGYISFFKEPQRYYWMDENTARFEDDISQDPNHPDFSGYWVRTTVAKVVRTGVITGARGLTPDFTADPTRQGRNLPVQFTSLTDPALVSSYLWDFGDGATSTEANPSHSYTDPGSYTVSLTVAELTGISFTETKPEFIEVLIQPFVEFTGAPREGELNPVFQANFQDQSDGGPSGAPVAWEWDFGDGSPTSPDANPNHEYEDVGFFAVGLTVTFADGSVESAAKPDYIIVREPVIIDPGPGGGGSTASLIVTDAIAAGDVNRAGHALVPLNDWVPLFNINMAPDNEQTPATRFLETLTYTLNPDFDPGNPDPDFDPDSIPLVSDILEFGLFVEGPDPDEEVDEDTGIPLAGFDGALTNFDTLLFTWDNTGAPLGSASVDEEGIIQYQLNFVGSGSSTSPDFRVETGPTLVGQPYIVAMRTSATWRHGIAMTYEVFEARMAPFFVDQTRVPIDTYTPNFFSGINDEDIDGEILENNPLYTSSFRVYDVTSGTSEPYDPLFSNEWSRPLVPQIAMAEFSRPRFNPAGTIFDLVAGHIQSMRQLFAVDTWVPALGIDLHATPLSHTENPITFTGTDPLIPQASLREVNVVFTDIGADPFGEPGNGGFDPRSGLESFFEFSPNDLDFLDANQAVGRDIAFSGVSVFVDTNNNGLFDPPTPANDGFGVTFTDYRLLPDVDLLIPEWEYVPFPPGGGDPWWKIKLLFSGGSRQNVDSPIDGVAGFVEPVPDPLDLDPDDIGTATGGFPEQVDYFVVFRADGGFTDVSTVPGDGAGLTPGADTRVFIEPRRIDPLTGSNSGGINVDSMIPYAYADGLGFPVWQDDPRWGDIEPWWPQRTLTETNAKPLRSGVEIHDLVTLYESKANAARVPDTPFFERDLAQWLDPAGLIAAQFLNLESPQVIFRQIDFQFTAFGVPLIFRNTRTIGSNPAFESVPFFLPEFDADAAAPRSSLFQNLPPLPPLPEFFTWPGVLAPGAYPHLTDWAPEDRQARLLAQRVDSRSGLTPLLGFNLVGNGDPRVLASTPSTLDEFTVALWGPGFTPSDLLPLDPEGSDMNSGVTLWADDIVNTNDGVFLSSPEANFGVAGALFSENIVVLNLLDWQDAAEPVDIDGDGVADDLDGDGDVDGDDNAWVLTITPAIPIVLPADDQDNAGTAASPNNFGDDLFFVVRTSGDISAHEKFRAFVPATLPSRAAGQRQAGMRFTPQGFVSASALTKRNPEEGTVIDLYSHDMLDVNVPVDIVSIAPRGVQLRPTSPTFPVFGIDASTNRPELTLEIGTDGIGAPSLFVDTSKAWAADAYNGKWLVDSGFVTFAITSNTADRLTLLSGEPASGPYYIVKDPTFLEQIIVEFERVTDASTFSFFIDLLPLAADQSVSGVAIYRDNDRHPDNLNGVFDPGIDIPVVLDDPPALVGGAGQPTAQVKFVMSSPGTDDFPAPLEEQPNLRQWVPNAQGGPGATEFEGPDFFIVLRPSAELGEGDDFKLAIVSWGPNTPSEPDPDTFTFPLPPEQPADEFKKFSEFPFGSRALGFITFYEDPPTRYWMRDQVAYSEPDPSPIPWIRSTTSKAIQSADITALDALVTPTTIVIGSATPTELPFTIADGETVEVILRGENFGSAARVSIGGYLTEVMESADDVIRLELSDLPNVEPQVPVVVIVRNPFTNEEASRSDLFTLVDSTGDGTQVLEVVPARGASVDFPVMVIGENFSQMPNIEVTFGEMIMPVISVSEDGTTISIGFPPGGMPDTGDLDVQVKNFASNSVMTSQDTLLSGFTFLNEPDVIGPCFIATAAFGSPLETRLDTFRGFRDGVLLQSAAGIALVDVYYSASPALADEIAARPWLAEAVRTALIPVAWFLEFPMALALALMAIVAASLGRRNWRSAKR